MNKTREVSAGVLIVTLIIIFLGLTAPKPAPKIIPVHVEVYDIEAISYTITQGDLMVARTFNMPGDMSFTVLEGEPLTVTIDDAKTEEPIRVCQYVDKYGIFIYITTGTDPCVSQ